MAYGITKYGGNDQLFFIISLYSPMKPIRFSLKPFRLPLRPSQLLSSQGSPSSFQAKVQLLQRPSMLPLRPLMKHSLTCLWNNHFNQTRWSERTADHVTLWRLFSSFLALSWKEFPNSRRNCYNNWPLDTPMDCPIDCPMDCPIDCPIEEEKKTDAKALHGQRFSLTTYYLRQKKRITI